MSDKVIEFKVYEVTDQLHVLRYRDEVHLFGLKVDVVMSLRDAHKVGTILRDITDDNLVETGCVGMDPSAHSLDRREYEEDS